MTTTNTERTVQVQSVMQRHPVTIHDYQCVQEAVDKMAEHHVSALPVLDKEGHVKGILTLSDLLRVVQDAERTLESDVAIYDQGFVVADMIRETLGTDEVINVMSGLLIKVKLDDPLKEAAKLMVENQVHHVLVVSDDMRLLGIVSAIDFVRMAAEEC